MKKIVYFMHLSNGVKESFRSEEFLQGNHPIFTDWLKSTLEEVEKKQGTKMIVTNINILTYEI